MCKIGGLFFKDYGAAGECGGANQPSCCGTGGQPPCDQILLYDWSNVANGNVITIFDETHAYESGQVEARTIIAPPVNNGDGSITVTINSALAHSYRATDNDGALPPNPIFSNGHSGGACIAAQGFYEADSSRLNKRDKTGAFDDAFVSFKSSNNGANVVPYMPQAWFDIPDLNGAIYKSRFSQIWFKNFINGGGGPPPYNKEHNYMHLIGASKQQGKAGLSWQNYDWAYIYIDSINEACQGCSEQEKANYIKQTTAHEMGHQFWINLNCADQHCDNDAWCGLAAGSCINPIYNEEYCLMRRTEDPNITLQMKIDGIDRFDCNELLELTNQCGVTQECQAEGISIRTINDPI